MGMNRRHALALSLLLATAAAPLTATPADMTKALYNWRQQMTEYRAALRHARTPEQQAAVRLPDANTVAGPLWKSISGKTGQREVTVQPSPEERMRGVKPGTEKRDTYEFEEEWAAPAVIWFVNHPQELARLYEGKPRQVAFYADALLDTLERTHYSSPMVAEGIAKLTESGTARAYTILEKIYTRNNDPIARGYAALGMSVLLGNPLVAAEAGSPAMARGKRVYYLKQALALTPEASEFGGVPVSDIVLEQSYRLKHLAVGSVPPQVSVSDRAGKTTTLPLPGKPTLILFWHPGEQVSADMARKLPTLKQKYPELELAAITAAPDSEESERALEESGVESTYVDDAKGSTAHAFRVAQMPTAVLLNDRCHILYIGYPDMHLQAAIDSCFQSKPGNAPHVRVVEEEKPVLQPGSQPKANDEAPALRDMPEF